jgi:autotransporter translocation and assembly factor TamB
MEHLVNFGNYQRNTIPVLAARIIIAVITLPMVAFGWQTGASPAAPCLAVGQMSGWDTREHTISLKSDSGHYSEVRYDDSTTFTESGATLLNLNLNVDDRVCVQTFRDHPGTVASRVLIIMRSQIDNRDKADLLEWERDSVFGTVKSLDTDNGRISLRTPGGRRTG